MSLKAQRKSSGVRQDLKESCEEADDHHLRRASSLAERLLPLLAMKFLGVLVLEEKKLELAKAWKEEDLVKG
jgi:hypothetical protein